MASYIPGNLRCSLVHIALQSLPAWLWCVDFFVDAQPAHNLFAQRQLLESCTSSLVLRYCNGHTMVVKARLFLQLNSGRHARPNLVQNKVREAPAEEYLQGSCSLSKGHLKVIQPERYLSKASRSQLLLQKINFQKEQLHVKKQWLRSYSLPFLIVIDSL